jgi:hypothetical protein
MTYQWSRNGSPIIGATSSLYTTTLTTASDNGSQFTVRVSNSAGNVVSIPPTLTVKPVSTPPGCLLSAGTWVSTPLAQVQTSSFRIQFDVTPGAAIENGISGMSAAPGAAYTDLAASVRFNPGGMIDARNGDTFAAATAIPYIAGTAYHFILDVNISTHTYNAYVMLGSQQVAIGTTLAFRTEQASKMSRKLVYEFSLDGATALLPEFNLLYQLPEKSPSGLPTLYLSGPEDYIEHGGLAQPLPEPPDWLPRTGRYNRDGMMEVRGPHKKLMVQDMFKTVADNITFYLAYGLKRKARFLSDMRGETDFLDWINHDEDMTAKSVALNELQHSVPILGELSVATILRIRKSEKDAFESYQNAVTKMSADILGANSKVSKQQARQIVRDAIEPELDKMKRELATHRKVTGRKALAGATAIAVVALGAYAGLLPLTVPVAEAAALVGGTLLYKAANAICEHGPTFQQKNDLYFLLKLTEEA